MTKHRALRALPLAAAVVVLGLPGAALAHTGELDFAGRHSGIPLVLFFLLGGVGGVLALLSLAVWTGYSRTRSLGGSSLRTAESQTWEEDNTNAR